MPKPKTNNHPSGIKKTKAFHGAGETTLRRLSTSGGPAMVGRRKNESILKLNLNPIIISCYPDFILS